MKPDFSYDASLPLDIKEEAPAQQRGAATVKDITFDNAQDGRVSAYLVEPDGDGPHPAILYVHWLEPEAETSNRTEFLDEAVSMAEQGVVSLLVDCFWSMTPEKWEAGIGLPWRSEVTYDSQLITRQVIELRRALDLLLAREDVDPERVLLVGHDFGGMCGALVAGAESRVCGYALMAATTAFGAWFIFGEAGAAMDDEQRQQYQTDMSPFDPVSVIGKAAPAPVLMQFADDDFYVPNDVADAFFAAAGEPKTFKRYVAGHDLEDAAGDCRRDRVAWVSQQLKLD